MPKKEIIGQVVSNKMDKTIVVAVEETHRHAKYGKYMKRTMKFKAHDPDNTCQIGDRVRIEECRPLSREKNWRLTNVLEQAETL